MIAEQKIIFDMKADGRVVLTSNRTDSVTQLLVGRKPEEVLELLPLMFSICAKSHLAAARAALGMGIQRRDRLLVLAENAREHLLRIMLGWKPEETREPVPAQPVMALIVEIEKAEANAEQSAIIEGLSNYLEIHVFGCTCDEFLRLEDAGQFLGWLDANDTGTTAYLQEIISKEWPALGAVAANFLPEICDVDLHNQLGQDGFTQQPDWLGNPCETGPLARQKGHPLLKDMVGKYGAGLLARMVARLIDLARIPDQMKDEFSPSVSQNGLGIIETARGRLVHSAKLVNGVVAEYLILAPTEWNFHTNGVAVQSLEAIPAANSELLVHQARAVIEAIDPCVEFELRVANA